MHPVKADVVYVLARKVTKAELQRDRLLELLKLEKERTEVLSAIAIMVLPAKPGVH